MGYIDLYVKPSKPMLGSKRRFDEARYIILGVPFDGTSTFRSGSRFTPSAIRVVIDGLETYSIRSGIDFEDVMFCDIGDLHESLSAEEVVRMVKLVVSEIAGYGKIPVIIGGEHTLTLGAVEALPEIQVVFLDAHFDLRDEYLDSRLCHATVARRVTELGNVKSTLHIGVRAPSKEEYIFASSRGIPYVTTLDLKRGSERVKSMIDSKLDREKPLYISIDMDVLDPAYAPSVANPEPDGIDTGMLIDIIGYLASYRVAGLDIVEATPVYDNGLTIIQASKILIEAIGYIEAGRR
ncbi:MAG: agmatinase [Candidatus Bathyarchaeota archaeon]|nr:agmatinase [Candidatus Bathyarchaeota archaeon]